jgi:YidC/Oxa1 family membrane protein insertase
MSDQVRGIIFVIVALIILFVWQHFYKPAAPIVPAQSAQTSQQTPSQNSGNASPGTANTTTGNAAKTGAAAKGGAAAVPANAAVVQASNEQIITINSPLYSVALSNHGAVVRTWQLNKYFDDQKPPKPLDLVNDAVAQQLGWPFSLMMSDPKQEAAANAGLYQISVGAAPNSAAGANPASSNIEAVVTTTPNQTVQAPAEIDFHWSDGHLDVTKKLAFSENYELKVSVVVTMDGAPQPAALAWRGGFGDRAVYNAAQLVTVYYSTGGSLSLLQYKKLGVKDNQGQPAIQNGPLEYAGIEDQFFTAAFIPDGTNLSLWHWKQDHNFVADNKQQTEPEAEMAAGNAAGGPLTLRMYVGPKDLSILEKMQPSLTGLVNFGWMGVIAKPLLWVLQTIHTKIPNWGWCIVLMTVVINIALFPLKMRGWRSMQKMQRVGPEIRQIQDRYKKYKMNDPRKAKMNEEVMAVYSREGINPLGSCLPMLTQLPIWWALWRVLNGAIELRHAPWLGWIHDLSAMDPYYILPIAMALLMFVTNRMTPQTTVDPSQQRMMAFMPLFMLFFFYRLSSGLNLYMSTSSIVAIAQQYYLNKTEPLPSRSKFKNKDKDKD